MILEPDNEKTSWPAWRMKRNLPRFPSLLPGDEDPAFRHLWDYALRGRRARQMCGGVFGRYLKMLPRRAERAVSLKEQTVAAGTGCGPRATAVAPVDRILFGDRTAMMPRLLKSVHIPFCAEWVVQRIQPANVIVIVRNPLSTIASMKRLGMPDGFRIGSLKRHLTEREQSVVAQFAQHSGPPYDIRLVALQVFKMHQHLQAAARRNRNWIVVNFEDLCVAPAEAFRSLFDRIGLSWRPSIESRLEAMNRPGDGYETRRIAAQQIDSWKRDLSAADIAAIETFFPDIVADKQLAVSY
jgi:hypothetical protein